jgi:hypothetical protein
MYYKINKFVLNLNIQYENYPNSYSYLSVIYNITFLCTGNVERTK